MAILSWTMRASALSALLLGATISATSTARAHSTYNECLEYVTNLCADEVDDEHIECMDFGTRNCIDSYPDRIRNPSEGRGSGSFTTRRPADETIGRDNGRNQLSQ